MSWPLWIALILIAAPAIIISVTVIAVVLRMSGIIADDEGVRKWD